MTDRFPPGPQQMVFWTATNWAAFNRDDGAVDFEFLYTMVYALESVRASDSLALPFAPRYNDERGGRFEYKSSQGATVGFGLESIRDAAASVRSELNRVVHERLPDPPAKEALELYQPLLSRLFGLQPQVALFTTNYDRTFEVVRESGLEPRFEINDGFARTGRGTTEWSLDNYVSSSGQPTLHLYKLHGSLNWVRRDNAILQGATTHYLGEDEQRGANALIYPLRKHTTLGEPFASCYATFQQVLQQTECLLVVGASLRDEHILTAIREALLGPGRLGRVLILDPLADRIAKQLQDSSGRAVVPLTAEFGSEEALSVLDHELPT